jgi:hypothetical protein
MSLEPYLREPAPLGSASLAPSIFARLNRPLITPNSAMHNDIRRSPIVPRGGLKGMKCGEPATPIGGVLAGLLQVAGFGK